MRKSFLTLVVIVAALAVATPAGSVWGTYTLIVYYSNEETTDIVGACSVGCYPEGLNCWGTQTVYWELETYSCPDQELLQVLRSTPQNCRVTQYYPTYVTFVMPGPCL
jgi:hypothetical protein